MPSNNFKALLLEQSQGKTVAHIRQLNLDDLPDEDVLVQVDYSSLNYKDGMAVTGTGKIVLNWPLVPGIDLAGKVIESANNAFKPGDAVVLTGWSVGEKYWGGYSQMQRVKADWLVPLPKEISAQQAMAIGTAGLTAMLCVMALEEGGVTPDKGPVIVTGSSGGVGSVGVALLAAMGYEVVAITGRESSQDYLKQLGANEVILRSTLRDQARPLEKQRWAGAIDTVGGEMLARLLAETCYNGTVAACGLAGSFKLPTTVMPFILRNIRLQGIDSVMCPKERRQDTWQRLATDLPSAMLDNIGQVISLEQVPEKARAIMHGQIKGRVIVDLNA